MSTTAPYCIEVVSDASCINALATVHRGAFMAHNIGPSYPQNVLSSYLALPDIEKYWEQSVADPNRIVRVARLGKDVIGVSEIDTQDTRADNITALYVACPRFLAAINRTLFGIALREAIQSRKTSITAVTPEGSQLRTFYEGCGMRRNTSANPIALPGWVDLPQIKLARGLGSSS